MNNVRRRAWLLAAGMGATAAVSAYLKPSRGTDKTPALDLDRVVPDRFGVWQLDRLAAAFVRASDRRGSQLRLYDQVLERTFINDLGQRVMLSVAYGATQSSDLQMHRPEVCYRAGGFEVRDVRDATLTLDRQPIAVKRLRAEMPGRPEPITYWMVVGGRVVAESTQAPLDRLIAAWRRPAGDGLLVRVSSIDVDAERAYRLHGAFADAMLRALAPADRLRLAGSGTAS